MPKWRGSTIHSDHGRQTGVEWKPWSPLPAAALTVYDMCKALDKGMEITASFSPPRPGGRVETSTGEGCAEARAMSTAAHKTVSYSWPMITR